MELRGATLPESTYRTKCLEGNEARGSRRYSVLGTPSLLVEATGDQETAQQNERTQLCFALAEVTWWLSI